MKGFMRHGALALGASALLVLAASAPLPAARAATMRWSSTLKGCWAGASTRGAVGHLGGDSNALYFTTRWFAGATQTIVEGTAPQAIYWSLTFYHQRHGYMVNFYDHQMIPYGQTGHFIVAVGGRRPRSHRILWADPTVGGGDAEGYLAFRIYQPTGPLRALPTITFRGAGPEPAAVATCTNLRQNLFSALRWSIAATRKQAEARHDSMKAGAWMPIPVQPTWSLPFDARTVVPPTDVTAASLVNQFANPNDVYRSARYNVSNRELVVHGTLPPISMLAPLQGVRYFSLCVYPDVVNPSPQTCLTGSSLKADATGAYTAIVSSQQPGNAANWLNTKGVVTGTLLMRWTLPRGGLAASFCLPALAYRAPGGAAVPPLPASCRSTSPPAK